MKKILSQISLILFIIIILTASFFIKDVKADSIAGINCPSTVNVNSDFNVALILPSNTYAAEATITVRFSDGTTSSGKIVYFQGMENSGFSNVVTLRAKAEGPATVTASNIVISDVNSKALENGGSKSQSLTVVNPNASSAQTPAQTAAPATDNNGASTTTATTTQQVNFKDVNETVYTTDSCNVRESYSTSSNKVAKIAKATELKRTGIGDNGWSRVIYNGKTCYISSQFLTTAKPADPTFTDSSQTMYATQSCNVRKSWNTESDKVGYLEKGQEVTVIAVSNEIGWSKIKYEGQDAYVASRLLTNEKPEETEEPEETDDENPNDEEPVEEKDELTILQEEIGVIPEVGKNVATYIYSVITIIALISTALGYYFVYKKEGNIRWQK